jgi:2-methylisocitrate lyase-like PEP mutase family enzyme
MKNVTQIAALCAATFFVAGPALAAAPVLCENMLKEVKAAAKDPKHAAFDKAKFDDLQSKGIERCKADDDAGADALFTEALKLAGK